MTARKTAFTLAMTTAIALVGLAVTRVANAIDLVRFDKKLVAADSAAGDLFGKLVDLDDGVAVVQSRFDYSSATRAPQTHVFQSSPGGAWTETGVTTHALEADFYSAGLSAALDGGVIINGAVTTTTSPSRISAFKDVTFTSAATAPLGAANPIPPDPFFLVPGNPDNPFRQFLLRSVGYSVDISGDIAVASDNARPLPDGPRNVVGAMHVYERRETGEWAWSSMITPELPPDLPYSSFSFGAQVVVNGTTAMAIGNPRAPYVFFFEREAPGQWRQSAFISTNAYDSFGVWDIALDGDTAVVRKSKTFVLNRTVDDGWELAAEIDVAAAANSGRTIALEGDLLALTSETPPRSLSNFYLSVVPTSITREVMLYRRDDRGEWSLLQTIQSPDPAYDASFGSSLALNDGRLLVGASGEQPLGSSQLTVPGAAFLFLPVPEPATGLIVAFGGLAWIAGRRMGGVLMESWGHRLS